jgi:hypothetical protein
MKVQILAAGPIIKEMGCLPCRTVLRVFLNDNDAPTKFVVHTQAFDEGKVCYCSGYYYECGKSGTAIMEAYEHAFEKFTEKMKEESSKPFYDALFNAETTQLRQEC